MAERQKYEIMEKFDRFELRRYEPCVLAEVSMESDYGSAATGAFRGRATKRLAAKFEEKLRTLATLEKIELSPEVRIHRFDPPFKPGLMQYNEIVIPKNTAE